MRSARFRCPECDARLDVDEVPSSGKVRCRKCGARVDLDDAISPDELPRRRSSHRDDRDDDLDRLRLPAKRPQESTGWSGVAIGAICGGGVLVVGLVILVVVFLVSNAGDGNALLPGGGQAELPAPAEPGGGLALNTLAALKRSTVFIKVDAGDQFASGSGFLARLEGDTAFVVTNHHVITPPPAQFMPFPGRFGGPRRFRFAPQQEQRLTYTLVFGSGTAEEKSLSAEVASQNKESDLAILRVRGLQNPPPPVPLAQNINLVETMPVFILGFPFGEQLALDRGNPAITVGKGSVSSIRMDKQGHVGLVQINGDLNPGNSGGPVVDSQGRVIGIAVATVKGTQIGLAIPVAKLTDLLAAAPAQGVPLQPQPENPAPLFPGPPQAFPNQPPALVTDQPLDEGELDRLLQNADSGRPALINNALVRLSHAKPLEAQRPRVVKVVEPLVAKEDFTTGMYALKVLGVWGNKDNVPAALGGLKSTNVLIRLEAIRTLGKFKDARAAEPLAQRLPVFQDRHTASQALKDLGSAAEKAVQPFVRNSDVFIRHEACKILEVIGTEQSMALLTEACQDTNGLVRRAAEQALAAVQGRKK